jgi:hypothetical protein
MINVARTMTTRANRLLPIFIITVLMMCILEPACGQNPEDEMVKLLGGKYWSDASSVEKTTDGGYIIVGTNNSDGIGSENLWLVKTDSGGVTKWEKNLGTSKSIGRFIFRTDDNSYLISAIELKDNTDTNAWVIKTNSAGGVDNETVLGGQGKNQVFSILKTNDGNYTLIGCTDSSKSNSSIWLIKLSRNNSVIWKRSIDLGGNEIGRSAVQTNDGNYLIAGYGIASKMNQPDALLIAADLNGTLKYNETVKNLNDSLRKRGLNKIYLINKTKDGYIFLGTNESLASDKKDSLLVKLFENGTEDWNCSFDDTGYNAARSAIETREGEYVIVGETNSNDHGSLDAWIAKVNSTGSKVWSRAIGGAGYDIGNSVLQAEDGGFVIAGATGSYGNRTLNGWLLKVNSSGFEEWNTTLGLPAALITKTTIPEEINTTIVDCDKRYSAPIFNAANIFLRVLLTIIGVVIGIFIIWRLCKEIYISFFKQKRQLFTTDIENASGDASFAGIIKGLSEQIREQLIKDLNRINKTIASHSAELGIDDKRPPEFCYLPEGTDTAPLKELISSLKDVVPEPAKPFLPFLGFIYPKPYGVKASCTLQGHKDQSDTLGITAKLADLKGNQTTILQTFLDTPTKSSDCAEKPLSSTEKIKTLEKAASYLEDIGLFADALKYRKEAFKIETDPDSEKKIIDANKSEDLDKKSVWLKKTDLSRYYYDMTKGNKGRLSQLEKYYEKSLICIDVTLPLKKKAAFGCINEECERYFDLAKEYEKQSMLDEALELFQKSKEKGDKRAASEIYDLKKRKLTSLREAGKELQKLCRYSGAKELLQSAYSLFPRDNEIKNLLDTAETGLIKSKKTYDRSKNLLKTASWWLAVETTYWAMLDSLPADQGKFYVSRYRAGANLFRGILKLSYASQTDNQDFYEMAERDFNNAILDFCEHWYRPYALLGDLYWLRSQKRKERLILIKSAISFYRKALSKICTEPDSKGIYYEESFKDYNNSCVECISRDRSSLDKEFIEMNLASAEFLYFIHAPDNACKSEFLTKINDLIQKRLCKCLSNNEDFNKYMYENKSSRFIYNLACFIGLANTYFDVGGKDLVIDKDNSGLKINDIRCKELARKLLIYSLGRDRYGEVWKIVKTDLDLKDIVTEEMIEEIMFRLRLLEAEKNKKLIELIETDSASFQGIVNLILTHLKEMENKSRSST